jgi:hypothetical protein
MVVGSWTTNALQDFEDLQLVVIDGLTWPSVSASRETLALLEIGEWRARRDHEDR